MSELPLFKQIESELRQRILGNELRPGDKLPSEAEMIDTYGVSRITVRQALAELGLADKLFVQCGQLSGGQLQRVGIARVLYQRPALLLTDEPVSAMDPVLADHSLALLNRHAQANGVTLVASLHAVELALAHFPRVIGIREGQVVFDSPAEAVSPQANLIRSVSDAPVFPTLATRQADLGATPTSDPVKRIAHWSAASQDHGAMPFVVVDKQAARLYVFDAKARLQADTAVLTEPYIDSTTGETLISAVTRFKDGDRVAGADGAAAAHGGHDAGLADEGAVLVAAEHGLEQAGLVVQGPWIGWRHLPPAHVPRPKLLVTGLRVIAVDHCDELATGILVVPFGCGRAQLIHWRSFEFVGSCHGRDRGSRDGDHTTEPVAGLLHDLSELALHIQAVADATTCASDKGDRTSKLHSTMLRRTCVSIIMEHIVDSLRSKPQGRNPAR